MSASQSGTDAVPRHAWVVWLGIVGLIVLAAFLLFARAVERDLNHDEHQFLAPSALLTTGTRPYRDYPLFHLPNLI